MERRDRMLQVVRDAGFDAVGCLPLDAAGDPRIAAWLAEKHHGEMEWMERHRSAKETPAAAFPEFRSVIVAALEYGEVSPAPTDPRVGNISRYALGDDYHEVLKRRLFAAADRLRDREPEILTRAFVDTGPLNEKLIAARAGLGWVGKHTNLIDRRRGSYFFLGVLLVSAELPPTGPVEADRCGRCEACIPACPTGAIIAPYVLDARRCISYLTIELRGGIPRELRPAVGNRIFGCDDCQEVCPWNRFARSTPPPELAPRPGSRDTSLAEWLQITPEAWRARFRRSPVKRPRFLGFLRNVLVAAGNSGDPALAAAILPHLVHSEAMIRGHAAWALGRLAAGRRALGQRLEAALREERDPEVREELLQALGEQRLGEGPGDSPALREKDGDR